MYHFVVVAILRLKSRVDLMCPHLQRDHPKRTCSLVFSLPVLFFSFSLTLSLSSTLKSQYI